jgi:hypothetical protein
LSGTYSLPYRGAPVAGLHLFDYEDLNFYMRLTTCGSTSPFLWELYFQKKPIRAITSVGSVSDVRSPSFMSQDTWKDNLPECSAFSGYPCWSPLYTSSAIIIRQSSDSLTTSGTLLNGNSSNVVFLDGRQCGFDEETRVDSSDCGFNQSRTSFPISGEFREFIEYHRTFGSYVIVDALNANGPIRGRFQLVSLPFSVTSIQAVYSTGANVPLPL